MRKTLLEPKLQELYEFLERMKLIGHIREDEMSSKEIVWAEELVNLKLLSKMRTRLITVYSYGVGKGENDDVRDFCL